MQPVCLSGVHSKGHRQGQANFDCKYVTIMPGRGLSAGESSSSAAPPGMGATLDISVEVFGARRRRSGVAAACWSAMAGNSAASRGNSEETELPYRGFSSSTSEQDFVVVVHADGRSRLAKLKILSGKNVNRQGLRTGKILFTGKIFLTGKNAQPARILNRQDFLNRQYFS